jgi:hypothetical protein
MAEDEIAARRKAAERRERALRLRTSGVPYAGIAERLSYADAAEAADDVNRALDERAQLIEHERESGAALRLELERLDEIHRQLEVTMRTATSNGDTRLVLAATDLMLKVGAQRARLLGIDLGDDPEPYGEPDELLRRRQRKQEDP